MIKVLAAPINPSDIAFMKGNYSNKKYKKKNIMSLEYPTVAGWEGAGVVIEYGEGFSPMGWRAMGKRVAFVVDKGHPKFSKVGGAY